MATAGRRAVVARVDFGSALLAAAGGVMVEATVRGRLMGPRKALGNALVVGDVAHWVEDHGRAVVSGVEPRRNAFSRRGAGERVEEQVVAANLDQVVVVASVTDPPFRAGLVDRMLCQAEHAGIPARLALNKCDLVPERESQGLLVDYERAGYAAHALSARTGQGVEALRDGCRGRRSLFAGHSGVGKSTLLNALAPGIELAEGRVNPVTGKGRHTTSAAWLLAPEPDLELIDTPGIRAFGLWGIGPRDLDQAYPEFRPFLGGCRFNDCRHQSEPGCAVRAAVEEGQVSARRWESYRKLRSELEREAARL
ncbi:MAG TPA: ribosome small subunit-dependent GTPase A [Candidatus Eisenbacteria bacterium]